MQKMSVQNHLQNAAGVRFPQGNRFFAWNARAQKSKGKSDKTQLIFKRSNQRISHSVRLWTELRPEKEQANDVWRTALWHSLARFLQVRWPFMVFQKFKKIVCLNSGKLIEAQLGSRVLQFLRLELFNVIAVITASNDVLKLLSIGYPLGLFSCPEI